MDGNDDPFLDRRAMPYGAVSYLLIQDLEEIDSSGIARIRLETQQTETDEIAAGLIVKGSHQCHYLKIPRWTVLLAHAFLIIWLKETNGMIGLRAKKNRSLKASSKLRLDIWFLEN